MTETETLSCPGASLLGMSIITFPTSKQVTGQNATWQEIFLPPDTLKALLKPRVFAKFTEAIEAFLPTEVSR